MATAVHVANFFLSKVDREARDTITQLKLYKLVYYAQAWNLVFLMKPLFDSEIQAWIHGPVPIELRASFSKYGNDSIPEPESSNGDFGLDDKELKVLDLVWETYGNLNAHELRNLSHKELPWINARGNSRDSDYANAVIENYDIRDYYADYGSILKDGRFLIDSVILEEDKSSLFSFGLSLKNGTSIDVPFDKLEKTLQEYRGQLTTQN